MLATLEESVVYAASDTIEPIILSQSYDPSAWDQGLRTKLTSSR